MADYQAPDITEYMFVKDKYKKLQQSVRTLERKVEIGQVNNVLFFFFKYGRISPACSAGISVTSAPLGSHQTNFHFS